MYGYPAAGLETMGLDSHMLDSVFVVVIFFWYLPTLFRAHSQASVEALLRLPLIVRVILKRKGLRAADGRFAGFLVGH